MVKVVSRRDMVIGANRDDLHAHLVQNKLCPFMGVLRESVSPLRSPIVTDDWGANYETSTFRLRRSRHLFLYSLDGAEDFCRVPRCDHIDTERTRARPEEDR
jgi:hypothetical protein